MSDNVTLSSIDFLGLAEQKRVCRIDLADVGYSGVVYACDLSTAKQQEIISRPKQGKTRVYADRSMDINWKDMPGDAGPKFLGACLVTDSEGGRRLEAAFAQLDEEDDYIIIAADELVFMYDEWRKELKNTTAVMKRLGDLPNAVTNIIVRRVREISGMDDDEDVIEEKKES